MSGSVIDLRATLRDYCTNIALETYQWYMYNANMYATKLTFRDLQLYFM